MKTSGLLDQLLRSGQDLLQKQQSSAGGKLGKGGLSDLLSGVGGGSLGNALSGAGGGALAAGAMGLLLEGGLQYVLQTLDTYSVATNVNMSLINGTLPIMALAALIMQARDLIALLRKPASAFVRDTEKPISLEGK